MLIEVPEGVDVQRDMLDRLEFDVLVHELLRRICAAV